MATPIKSVRINKFKNQEKTMVIVLSLAVKNK